jgi:hypothetical protein
MGVRSGPTRGWCAAARKPTLTTESDSLCEVAHTARGKVTIISSDRDCPPWGRARQVRRLGRAVDDGSGAQADLTIHFTDLSAPTSRPSGAGNSGRSQWPYAARLGGDHLAVAVLRNAEGDGAALQQAHAGFERLPALVKRKLLRTFAAVTYGRAQTWSHKCDSHTLKGKARARV